MKNRPVPLFLSIKDMMLITGRGRSAVCSMRATIRKHLNKRASAPITMDDFCGFTGLREEKVVAILA